MVTFIKMQTVEYKKMYGTSNFADQILFFLKAVVMILHTIKCNTYFIPVNAIFFLVLGILQGVVNSQHNLFNLSVIYSFDFRGSLRKERGVQEQDISQVKLTNLDWGSGFFKLVRLKSTFFF